MKSLRKKILAMASVVAVSGLMMASVAGAADKLMVMDPTGATPVFKVDDAGVINGKAIITNKGWLGVGGSLNPLSAIHGKGVTAPETQLMMTRTDSAASGAGFLAYHNNLTAASCTAAGVPTACCTGPGTGPTCPTSVLPVTDTRLGYFLFGGYGTDMTTPKNAAGMASRAEAAWTDTQFPAYFTFETAPTVGAGRPERLRISANGNIVTGNLGGSATADMATTVTDGFLYIPNVAGALTTCSTVKQYTGHVPVWFDTTNSKICTCQGTTLKCTAALN